MNQQQLEQVLLKIKHELEEYCGIEPEVNYQGSIIVRNFIVENRVHIPEEIAKIIKDSLDSLGLKFNFTQWPQKIGPTGDLVIRYTP